MKQCISCKQNKPDEQFPWRNKAKGYKHGRCKPCYAANCNKYYHDTDKHKQRNRAIKNAAKVRERNRRFVTEQKICCQECGDTRPYVLDFHHEDGADKEFNISRMITDGLALSKIEQEIKKCVVLCSNCHREHHHFERMNRPL